MKKVALFIPTISYLAIPTFTPVAGQLHDFTKIYLNFHEFESDSDEIKTKISESLQLEFNRILTIEKVSHITKWPFSDFFKFKKLVSQIRKTIKTIAPDVIIFLTDKSFIFRVCRIFFPSIPRVVIQPASRRYFQDDSSVWNKIRFHLYYHLLKVPLYGRQTSFGLEFKDTFFLFWSDFWMASLPFSQSPHRLAVGAPHLDKYFVNDSMWRNRLTASEYSGNNKIVAIALSKRKTIGENKFMEFMDLLRVVVNRFPDNHFVIKVHPMEDEHFYASQFDQGTYPNVRVTKDENIETLISRCDVLLSPWSSVTYQAMAMGVPVILMNPGKQYDLSKKYPESFDLVAHDDESLVRLLSSCLFSEDTRKGHEKRKMWLEQLVYSTDGRSAERAARAIRQIAICGTLSPQPLPTSNLPAPIQI